MSKRMIEQVKRIIICLLLVLLSTAVIYAELIRKAIINPDGTIEYYFYDNEKEVARQKVDDKEKIIQTIGKIPNGVVRGYYESGKLEYECNYKDNKLEGVVKVYYENGKLLREWNYKDNKLNGITKWYYENGELMRQLNYKDGKREGLSKWYYENGGIKRIDTYKKDRLIKRKGYDEKGEFISELNFPTEKSDVK